MCGSENLALGLFPGFVGFCFLCRNGSVSEEQRFHPGHGLRGEGNRGRPAGFARLVEGRPCGPTFCEKLHEGDVILHRNDFAGAITALAVVGLQSAPGTRALATVAPLVAARRQPEERSAHVKSAKSRQKDFMVHSIPESRLQPILLG